MHHRFGSPFGSDFFLSWNCWNDNKGAACLICQLAFLSPGKYLISFFFLFLLVRPPRSRRCASINLLTLDKEAPTPSNTCTFAFPPFPTQTHPQAASYPKELHHLPPLFADMRCTAGHHVRLCTAAMQHSRCALAQSQTFPAQCVLMGDARFIMED